MRYAAICSGLFLVTGLAPAQNLWDLFSRTFTTNVLAWTRYNDNPVLGPAGSTWKTPVRGESGDPHIAEAHPALLPRHGRHGGDQQGIGRTGSALVEVSDIGAGRLTYREINNGLPVLDVGPQGSFDRSGVSTPGGRLLQGADPFVLYRDRRFNSKHRTGGEHEW